MVWASIFDNKKHSSFVLAAGVASLVIAGVAGAATARDDAGSKQFFMESSRGPSFARSVEAAVFEPPRVTPLAVGRSRRRYASGKRGGSQRVLTVHPGPSRGTLVAGASPRISMYNDTTLQAGDAVMTIHGLRIFQGSDTFPFRPEDFSTLDKARGLSAMLRKSLAEADQNPYGRVLPRQARL